MDRGIRQAALRAAAKTAILMSLSGCYDMHLRPERLASVDAGPVVDARPPREDARMSLDEGPPPAPDLGEPACSDLLGGLALTVPPPRGRWSWDAQFTDERARLDARVGACCLQLDADVAVSETPGDPIFPGAPLAMACCDVITTTQHLVSSASLGCTPWGPACPPEMSDEDELAAA